MENKGLRSYKKVFRSFQASLEMRISQETQSMTEKEVILKPQESIKNFLNATCFGGNHQSANISRSVVLHLKPNSENRAENSIEVKIFGKDTTIGGD